jgi:hypothetical protein
MGRAWGEHGPSPAARQQAPTRPGHRVGDRTGLVANHPGQRIPATGRREWPARHGRRVVEDAQRRDRAQVQRGAGVGRPRTGAEDSPRHIIWVRPGGKDASVAGLRREHPHRVRPHPVQVARGQLVGEPAKPRRLRGDPVVAGVLARQLSRRSRSSMRRDRTGHRIMV